MVRTETDCNQSFYVPPTYLGKMAKAFSYIFYSFPDNFNPYFFPAAPRATSFLGNGPKSKYSIKVSLLAQTIQSIYIPCCSKSDFVSGKRSKVKIFDKSVPLKTLWQIKLVLGIVFFLYLCPQLIRNAPPSLGLGRCPAQKKY